MIYTAPFVGGGVPCQARMDAEKYCAFVGNYVVGRPSPAQKPPAAVGLRNAPAGAEPSGRRIGFAINPVEPYMTRSRNGQDRSLQLILYCGANIQMICRAGCPHPSEEATPLLLNKPFGNTAQFPPDGLSTVPAAAARHLRCQNAR